MLTFEQLRDLFGIHFKEFDDPAPGIQIAYALHSQVFPIGYIQDRSTPPDEARRVIDKTLGSRFGPVYHLALGHKEHGKIDVVESVQDRVNDVDGLLPIGSDGDGVIIRRCDAPVVIETMLGDCCLAVAFDNHRVGFLHVGSGEVFAGAIENLISEWRKLAGGCGPAKVWFGPCIGGKHYQFSPEDIPESFRGYAVETAWGATGLDVHRAITDLFIREQPEIQILDVGIDPFAVNELGEHSWAASARWYKRFGEQYKLDLHSPRNMATVFLGSQF